jgi:hypothetical protein
VLVYKATLKEAVTYHLLAKQKDDDRQDKDKQELDNSWPGRPSFYRSRRIRIRSHLGCVSNS